ncbi:MAG TPA: hypothetical protein ENH29_03670 [Bacteroidetes bacterium]|nr:hypothetical protein [Bacteroidota bacterium]
MKGSIIYSDRLVEVYDKGILFRNYYFPFVSKFVTFPDILRLYKKASTLANGKWRIWGSTNFMYWYPLDWRRPRRTAIYFLNLASQKVRIGFTVEHPEQFSEVMKSKGIEIHNS